MAHLLTLVALLFACLLSAAMCLWCYLRWKHRHLRLDVSHIPPLLPTLPILGNLHYFVFGLEYASERAREGICDLLSRGKTTATLWLGPYLFLIVMGVEDIQKLLTSTKTSEKGEEMDQFKIFLGNGLVTAPGHIWKYTRRAIDPLFHPRNLEHMMPTFNSNSRELVENLAEYEGRGAFDIFPQVLNTTLKSVCQFMFGPEMDIDIKSEEFQKLIYVIKTAPDIGFQKAIATEVIFNVIYSKTIHKIHTIWNKFTDSRLKITRSNNAKKEREGIMLDGKQPNGLAQHGNKEQLNLIGVYNVLQKNHPEYTDEDLKYEIMTLYFTGSDSVSTAISTCLLHLADNQDIQEKLFEEISSVVGLTGDVTAEDYSRMPYMDQVYRETLRWSTIVPLITRKASEDIELSSCTIRKGCNVVVGIGCPHLDPNIYPQPEKFDPDRFSPENSKERSKYAYTPFSAGVRHCIGKVYNHMLVKTVLIHILRRFKVTTTVDPNKIKRKIIIFYYSTEGYHVSLHPRITL